MLINKLAHFFLFFLLLVLAIGCGNKNGQNNGDPPPQPSPPSQQPQTQGPSADCPACGSWRLEQTSRQGTRYATTLNIGSNSYEESLTCTRNDNSVTVTARATVQSVSNRGIQVTQYSVHGMTIPNTNVRCIVEIVPGTMPYETRNENRQLIIDNGSGARRFER